MAVVTKSSSSCSSSGAASSSAQSFLFRNRGRMAFVALFAWALMIAAWMGVGAGVGAGVGPYAASLLPSEAAAAVDEAASSSAEAKAKMFAEARAAKPPPPPPAGGSADVKSWRRALERTCEEASTIEEVRSVGRASHDKFSLPSAATVDAEMKNRASSMKKSKDDMMRRCKYVAIDFGANVGDTMAHMMDAGLVSCDRTRKLGEKAKSEAHFDQAKFELTDQPWNRITKFLVGMVASLGGDRVGPEDYCYYGVEGNPVFTERLRRAEAWASQITPKPLRHAHFLTETVGAGKDGPAQLWLDTVNAKQNYWGSSIFKSHQDVEKSAKAA
eukprot:CAMPEP_0113560752 /NCGR_PEP_ID=MMETSP0015_2-20120614/19602_1 /TAXON_ID=2838 /ORGANISM="Odontella" /LENGTH=328 /DNA_ID=CAMNT_0000462485 /DNA_START=207 /DNA_END=1190 /DNA_ORIENTATION=- /assembly_acc=CAM_ASM_000160